MSDLQEWELEDILDWSFRAQLGVVVGVMLLIQVIGSIWVQHAHYQQWSALKLRQQSLEHTVRVKGARLSALAQQQAVNQQAQQRYRQLFDLLSQPVELATIVADIHSHGQRLALSFTHLEWGDRQTSEGMTRVPVNIRLSGAYHAIGQFSEALAHLPYVISVEQVSWQRLAPDSDLVELQLQAFTYQAPNYQGPIYRGPSYQGQQEADDAN
ncbi:type 4a pilus biogenesis protein PilO [Vibrio sp. WXL210]|uniref:type 4a pilus biogenesis protein PilO n=1 Tax=Vibrio sp. WXL210 TaxID=3450709 RepID=UPI003EC5D880